MKLNTKRHWRAKEMRIKLRKNNNRMRGCDGKLCDRCCQDDVLWRSGHTRHERRTSGCWRAIRGLCSCNDYHWRDRNKERAHILRDTHCTPTKHWHFFYRIQNNIIYMHTTDIERLASRCSCSSSGQLLTAFRSFPVASLPWCSAAAAPAAEVDRVGCSERTARWRHDIDPEASRMIVVADRASFPF